VVAGSRYRAELDDVGAGNILDFADNTDTSFDLIGPPIVLPAPPVWLVVYNLGIPGADLYSGSGGANDVRRSNASAAGNSVSFTSITTLPFESPSRRFHIVSSPVTYACSPAVAGGTLARHSGYAFAPAQPVPPGGTSSLLASQVTSCSFSYSTLEVARSAGLVSMSIQLTYQGEAINLFQQVHVSNVP
jgi:MSHA biogenesis protein MshO